MQNPDMTLFSSVLEGVLRELSEDASNDGAWSSARTALAHYGVGAEEDAELVAAIEARDAAALGIIVATWTSGERLMLEHDRGVLKRALKAYRKRLKVTVLDAESSVAGGPMSAGRRSSIVGIVPPDRYPLEVWDELVRQKRLLGGRDGIYELPPGS